MKANRSVLLVLLFIFFASILPVLGHAADRDRESLENLLADLEKKIKEAEHRRVPYPEFLEGLKSLIKDYRSGLREPYHEGRRPDRLSRIEGLWFFSANNFPGKLEFHWAENVWTGRLLFDNLGQWEELKDILIDPRTDQVQFRRPALNQVYAGTLSGDRIVGTFGFGAPGVFPWEAWRR